MFCFVSILVVLTMKTNEAVGYQGCPIHLVAQHFLLSCGSQLGGHYRASNYAAPGHMHCGTTIQSLSLSVIT